MTLSISRAISEGSIALSKAGINEARRESGSLLGHVIAQDRSYLITNPDFPLSLNQEKTFQTLLERRAAGEPLQYITGHQEFYKLDFEVTPDVLIPRPETELIVEIALALLRDIHEPMIADLGTGSGCIAISLLHELRHASSIATDISPEALAVAERNARRHDVLDRLKLVRSDCFSQVGSQTFSIVVSNPPYVADNELEGLQREVREHEPQYALRGGKDGLDVIRRLLVEAPRFLASDRSLVFEIGFGQSEEIKRILDLSVWDLVEIRPDQQNIPRVVVLKRK